jgi:hypothetical protein
MEGVGSVDSNSGGGSASPACDAGRPDPGKSPASLVPRDSKTFTGRRRQLGIRPDSVALVGEKVLQG